MADVSWYLIGVIFLIGLWGLIAVRNLVKKVVALSIANSAVIMFFVYYASLSGTDAPIVGGGGVPADPLPHALMLTAIVVGVCVASLALVMVYVLYRRYGTLDMEELEGRVWGRDARSVSNE